MLQLLKNKLLMQRDLGLDLDLRKKTCGHLCFDHTLLTLLTDLDTFD